MNSNSIVPNTVIVRTPSNREKINANIAANLVRDIAARRNRMRLRRIK